MLDPLEVVPVVNPQSQAGIIFNDGKYDSRGRYFVGTMHRDFIPGAGMLWRLDPDWDRAPERHRDHGFKRLAWSPDNRTMYFADSRSLVVYAYDHDIETDAADH